MTPQRIAGTLQEEEEEEDFFYLFLKKTSIRIKNLHPPHRYNNYSRDHYSHINETIFSNTIKLHIIHGRNTSPHFR